MDITTWRTQGRWLGFLGHKVFYRAAGPEEAPTLLCIHGFPTASWDYHAVLPALAARYRVIAPDMLGFGFTDKPRGLDYTISLQADLHETLLEHLGIDRCLVLAHDYGDTVTQELLARHLERRRKSPGETTSPHYRGIVLLNGGLFPETHRPRPIQNLLASPIGFLVARLLDESRFRRSFSRVFGPQTQPSEKELSQFWALICEQNGHRLAHRLIRYMGERRTSRERWVGALQETEVPLLLVNGALDPVSGQHMVERYRDLVGKPVFELPKVGHYPQIEDPATVARVTLEFFDSID